MEQETARRHDTAPSTMFAKVRLLATCIIAAILAVGVYYFFFVQRNYNYLSGRDFRYLAAIGAQLRSSISTRSKLIQSLAQDENLREQLGDPTKKRLLIDEFARGFEDISAVDKPADKIGQSLFALRRSSDEALIEVYFAAAPAGDPYIKGVMKLRTVAEPIFRSRKAFEAVLLASDDGEVVYRQGAQDLSVTRLNPLVEKSLLKSDPDNGKAEKVSRLLSSSSATYTVELNGLEYRLFVEPVRLPLQRIDAPPASGESVWLVCGLVPKKEFVYKSLSVSSSLLSGLLGLIILAALSWPFLKLALISKTQRVGVFDVILLGICSVLGVSIVTLFLLDTVYFLKLEDTAERQLQVLTGKMERNARREIESAYPVMAGLEKELIPRIDKASSERITEPDLLKTRAGLFFANYPLAQTFSLIGRDGQQIYKGTVNAQAPPLIPVRERAYFKQSLSGDTWDLRALGESPLSPADGSKEPFYIEPVFGWTTGAPVAILAKPVTQPSRANRARVASLAIPMVSLVNPILPPGVKFAVIDDDANGRVLFHSEPERMLNEEFLVETDQDRRLRSAIFARHAETIPTRYWGEDYLARVAPIRGLPWTIVALQDMRILRAVNIDWISTTLLMILLYTGAILLGLVAVALAKPAYRADWIWPDAERHHDYRVLARAYLILLGGFALALWGIRGSSQLLSLAFLLAALVVLMAYDRLRKRPAGDSSRRETATGQDAPRRGPSVDKLRQGTSEALIPAIEALALATLAALLSQAPLEEGVSGLLPWIVFLLALIACLAANGAAARGAGKLVRRWRSRPVPPRPEPDTGSAPGPIADAAWKPSVATSYCLCGILLLLLGAVMPTVGFFKVAYNLHSISFLRHGQLKMALDLKHRATDALSAASRIGEPERSCFLQQRLAVIGDTAAPLCGFRPRFLGLDVYTDVFYGTRVELPSLDPKHQSPQHNASNCRSRADLDIFPELIEGWLPRYSEPASEMRELLHSSSSDCMWYWETKIGPPYFAHTFHSRDYPQGEIHLYSPAPSLHLRRAPTQKAFYLSIADGIYTPPSVIALSVLFSGIIILVAFLVHFVARRIFLIDLLEPLWRDERETGPATLGRNLFLVGRDRNWKEDVKRNLFFWFHFKDLEDPEKGWPACRPALLESDRVILVEGFEHRLRDPEFNLKKLLFLEELATMQERTVVVISTISPSRLFSREIRGEDPVMSSPSMAERWRNLLSMFTVHEDDLQGVLRRVESSTTIDSEVLKLECGINPHLLSIAQDLDRHVRYLSREQILEELGERAEGYYQGLWASCSSEEQVVLEHLAEEGLVNEKSRRIVRRLMARGFVRREPNFRLINETFRRFVASSTQKVEVLRLEREAAPSAWDRLRLPLFVGLAASLVFFFTTQQELLDGVAASVTGLTAGLPAIIKLFDFFGTNRAGLPRLPNAK
jgi:hypothetical protein